MDSFSLMDGWIALFHIHWSLDVPILSILHFYNLVSWRVLGFFRFVSVIGTRAFVWSINVEVPRDALPGRVLCFLVYFFRQ